jgi:inosine/xanthosine triphosphatase
MRLVVASRNPVKARAVKQAFERAFPQQSFDVVALAVDSGVADQPMSDVETREGAENRLAAARALMPDADWWVGIEGGIEDSAAGMLAFAWAAVENGSRHGRARSLAFPLPEALAERVSLGMELGEADDDVFGQTDSKRRDGAIGLLTGGLIDRTALYEPAVVAALIPALNPGLYHHSENGPAATDGQGKPLDKPA